MRICFFGDSLVNGTRDPECLGWVGRVCAEKRRNGHDLTIYNLGIRRDTSSDVRQRWREEALLRLPAELDGRLVFSFGVNDCTMENGQQRVAPARTLDNLRAILGGAGQWRRVLFVGPSPVADSAGNERIATLSSAMAKACRDLGVPYLEVFSALAESTTWMREVAEEDGAHPGAPGYALLASLVSSWQSWRAWF